MVGVDHQGHLVANGLADGPHVAHVGLEIIADLELEPRKAVLSVAQRFLDQGLLDAGHTSRLRAGGLIETRGIEARPVAICTPQ